MRQKPGMQWLMQSWMAKRSELTSASLSEPTPRHQGFIWADLQGPATDPAGTQGTIETDTADDPLVRTDAGLPLPVLGTATGQGLGATLHVVITETGLAMIKTFKMFV